MAKFKILIGDKNFKFLTEAKKYASETVQKNLDKVIDENHIDFKFFRSLIERHPDFLKFGNPTHFLFATANTPSIKGVDNLTMFRGEPYRPFYKTGDDWHVFSMAKCLGKTHDDEILIALRGTITPYINRYRRENPECACCGCKNFDELEVDHKCPDFKEIAKDFLCVEGRDLEILKIGVRKILKNQENWVLFHNQRAILQTLCNSCHKLKTKEGKSQSSKISENVFSSITIENTNPSKSSEITV